MEEMAKSDTRGVREITSDENAKIENLPNKGGEFPRAGKSNARAHLTDAETGSSG
jgi:hypothetical protein